MHSVDESRFSRPGPGLSTAANTAESEPHAAGAQTNGALSGSGAGRRAQSWLSERTALFRSLAINIAVVLAYLLVWHTAAVWIDNRIYLPKPLSVVREGWAMLVDGTLASHVMASLTRVLLGTALGAAAGIILGAALATFRRFEQTTSYVIETLRTVSPIALIALFVVWFGIGEFSKILLIAFTATFPTAIATYHGLHNADSRLKRLFMSLGANKRELLFGFKIPAGLPFFVNGIRVAMTVAWYVLIVSEIVGGSRGLGLLVFESGQRFAAESMWVGIASIAGLGLLFDSILSSIEDRLRWSGVRGIQTLPQPSLLPGVFGLVCALILWEIVVGTGLVSDRIVAAPLAVAEAIRELAASGELWRHIGASLRILAKGLAISFTVGISLGILTGRFPMINVALTPLKGAIRNVNPLALFSLAILVFGIGDGSKVFVIAFGTVFIVWLQTHLAVSAVPAQLSRVVVSAAGTRWEVIRYVVIPAIVPTVINALRIATAFGFIAIVGAELIASNEGLGWLVKNARATLNVELMLAGIAVISILGFAANQSWLLVSRLISPGRRTRVRRRDL